MANIKIITNTALLLTMFPFSFKMSVVSHLLLEACIYAYFIH